jgi:hypothetical protein
MGITRRWVIDDLLHRQRAQKENRVFHELGGGDPVQVVRTTYAHRISPRQDVADKTGSGRSGASSRSAMPNEIFGSTAAHLPLRESLVGVSP